MPISPTKVLQAAESVIAKAKSRASSGAKTKKKQKNNNHNGKKGSGGGSSGGTRALLTARRFPSTYYQTKSGKSGEMIICGKEVISELSTTYNFIKVVDQPLNPSNQNLFPKLSALASTFEQYRFRKLNFHFVTGCAATTSGSVLHYVDYDVKDAAAPTALALLANQTAMVSSVSLDNSVQYDIGKQMLPKMFTEANPDNALAREVSVGSYRLYMDKGAATAVFAGYLYAEYEVVFWTPKPPTPTGGSGRATTLPKTVAAAGVFSPPIQADITDTGLPGQTASIPTASYTTEGGLVGAVDLARQVYAAGTVLANVYAAWNAAAVMDPKKSGERESKRGLILGSSRVIDHHLECKSLNDYSVDEEEFSCQLTAFRNQGSEFSVDSPLASGDITVTLAWYDVTDGSMHPDFPVSTVGMTPVGSQTYLYASGVGALITDVCAPFTIPAGKRYCTRAYAILGATTGRVCTDWQFGVNMREPADA